MRICYFGDYDPFYIRNEVIELGLRQNGVDIRRCHARGGVGRFFVLAWTYLKDHRASDLIVVGSSDTSRWIVVLARFLSLARIPLVWDAHYSIYDTYVNDRKLAKKGSLKALYYWSIDKMACVLANRVLLDTNAHAEFFADTFRVQRIKFIRVLVGADEQKFFPGLKAGDERPFIVSFHGKYIPLQGVEHIIRAAKILEEQKDIMFHLIGSGQTYKDTRELARTLGVKNVTFTPRVPYEEIPDRIRRAHISLGIFGDTKKAKRVIANKIYEAIAIGAPVISADTEGIRELFTDRENILLCRIADPADLAEKIILLFEDPELRTRIGGGGRRLFEGRATPKRIGAQLLLDLAPLLPRGAR